MTDDLTGLEETGPIDYLVVAFPHAKLTGEAFPLLVDLVDRGIIRILDLVFIQKDDDGSVSALELKQLEDGGADLTVFEGVSSGLLGEDDLAEAANALEPGDAADQSWHVMLLGRGGWGRLSRGSRWRPARR